MVVAADKQGWLGLLMGLISGRRRSISAPATTHAEQPPFSVAVATVGETEGTVETGLISTLAERPGLKPVRVTVPVGDGPSAAGGAATVIKLRSILDGISADIAIWVDRSEGIRLRWIGPSHPPDDLLGGFGTQVFLDLPDSLEGGLDDLVYAATLAAVQPTAEERRQQQRQLLAQAVPTAAIPGEMPPWSANALQRATMRLCFGHILAATAAAGHEPIVWLERAAAAYRIGCQELPPDKLSPLEEATAHRRRAVALTSLAERKGDDAACLEEAVAVCRAAAEVLPRAAVPIEWAAEQVRLGTALFRLDLQTGNAELLREAIAVFQGALQVFTKSDAPQRWAEVMHSLAQALEVYGDQSRNPEILAKAAEACRAVLELRTPEADRTTWAATSNTLGSILFLLDKHGGGTSHLGEAAELLRTAAGTFRALHADRQAVVAERNLAHVERLARQRLDRAPADPGWSMDETEGDAVHKD